MMKSIRWTMVCRALAVCAVIGTAPAAMAQKWEFGGGIGGSFYTSRDATNNGQTAKAGIKNDIASSLWLVNNNHKKWGGEIRLDYQRGDLRLERSSTEARFSAETYALHYDFQYHFREREARVRPFVAAGAGIKVFRGTGSESATQPLSNFAFLTKTTDLRPVISLGAGIKWQIARSMQFRLELHDYLTPFPDQIIAPNVGTNVSGWLNNLVPLAGISYTF
ncbi:MAG: hypothetical protein ABL967_08865 [Bryobacteraceae bacterium]